MGSETTSSWGCLSSLWPPRRWPLCSHRPAPVSLWHRLSLHPKHKSPSLEHISLISSVASVFFVKPTFVSCSCHLLDLLAPGAASRATPSPRCRVALHLPVVAAVSSWWAPTWPTVLCVTTAGGPGRPGRASTCCDGTACPGRCFQVHPATRGHVGAASLGWSP